MRFEPPDFFGADGKVVVLGHTSGRLRSNDQAVEADWVHVHRIANGNVARLQEMYDIDFRYMDQYSPISSRLFR